MMLAVVLAVSLLVCAGAQQPLPDNVAYRPGQCLSGDRHRELPCPQPEGPEYQACFQWSESTCCTAEFTTQLAGATVQNIDGFHWSRCDPPISQRCEEYFRRVECFYRCSPNVAHWELSPFPSALANLPVCGNFCDEWFDACASDLTCATNWITDWIYVDGINQCMDDAVCRNFSDVYGDGRGLCNTLWGQSFVYSDQLPTDPDRTCLSLWWPNNQSNPNEVAIRNTFGSEVDTVTPPPCPLPENVAYRPGQCLSGDRHRELPCPQPEGPEYQACFQWSESTCCTAEFTTQLAGATVQNIDGFHWSRCDPPISQRCEEYFRRVECFYRCSPNVAHWELSPFPSALANLPVCGNFCDEWFDACASDLTCATNWITDWLYVDGINQCMDDAECRNFSDVYGDGRGLCNTLWGQSFVYSDQLPTDPDRTCLSLWWPNNQSNPNEVALRNIFGSEVDTVTPPSCESGGIPTCSRPLGMCSVFMVTALLAMLVVGIH